MVTSLDRQKWYVLARDPMHVARLDFPPGTSDGWTATLSILIDEPLITVFQLTLRSAGDNRLRQGKETNKTRVLRRKFRSVRL